MLFYYFLFVLLRGNKIATKNINPVVRLATTLCYGLLHVTMDAQE